VTFEIVLVYPASKATEKIEANEIPLYYCVAAFWFVLMKQSLKILLFLKVFVCVELNDQVAASCHANSSVDAALRLRFSSGRSFPTQL
jgi:hypothetical protein